MDGQLCLATLVSSFYKQIKNKKGFYLKSWENHDKCLAPVQKEARLFITQGLNIR